jgi:hypothetical protein
MSLDSGYGGGSGIRTRDTVSRIHTFQACAFNRSATPPYLALYPTVSRVRLAFPPPLCWGMSHAASPIIAWEARASAEGPLFGATGGSQISEEASLVSIARQMGDIPRLFRPLAAAGRMNPCCRYVARARSYRPNENCHLSFRFVSLAFDPVRSKTVDSLAMGDGGFQGATSFRRRFRRFFGG